MSDEQHEQANEQEEAQPLTAEEQQAANAEFDKVFAGEPTQAQPAATTTDEPKAEETTTTTTEQPAKAPEKGAPSEPAAPAQAAAAAADEWEGVHPNVRKHLEGFSKAIGVLERIDHRLKSTEGRVGAMQAAMDAARTASNAGQSAPTKEAIAEATASSDKWKRLKEDFPDWADAMEERFASERAEMAKQQPQPGFRKEEIESLVESRVQQVLEVREVSAKHPGWVETINSPAYKAWMLEGGPSAEAYTQMKAVAKTDPAKATAMLNSFAVQHPQWWAEKGANIFDPSASGAIKSLDSYAQYVKTKSAPAQAGAKSTTKRLEAAVPATTGGVGARPTGMSERDAAQKAFDEVFASP